MSVAKLVAAEKDTVTLELPLTEPEAGTLNEGESETPFVRALSDEDEDGDAVPLKLLLTEPDGDTLDDGNWEELLVGALDDADDGGDTVTPQLMLTGPEPNTLKDDDAEVLLVGIVTGLLELQPIQPEPDTFDDKREEGLSVGELHDAEEDGDTVKLVVRVTETEADALEDKEPEVLLVRTLRD